MIEDRDFRSGYLSQLLHESKIRMEVLRLELEGTNTSFSIQASVPIKINVRFEATHSEQSNQAEQRLRGPWNLIIGNLLVRD